MAAVAVAMIGLRRSGFLPVDACIGLLLLVGAGVIAVLARRTVAGAIAALPGALVLAAAAPPEPSWASTMVVVTAIGGGCALAAFDRDDAKCAGPAMLAVSVAALYVSVPDTELPLVLLRTVPLFAIFGWPFRLARIGGTGAFAVCGLLAWVATVGGTGRPPSLVAGVGVLGLFLAAPGVGRMTFVARGAVARLPAAALLALHAGCVLVTARVAALRSSTALAAIVAGAGFAFTGVAFAALSRRQTPRVG